MTYQVQLKFTLKQANGFPYVLDHHPWSSNSWWINFENHHMQQFASTVSHEDFFGYFYENKINLYLAEFHGRYIRFDYPNNLQASTYILEFETEEDFFEFVLTWS